jgi:hypothetical protein
VTKAFRPNDAGSYGALAKVLNFAGQPKKAVGLTLKAMALNPSFAGNVIQVMLCRGSILKNVNVIQCVTEFRSSASITCITRPYSSLQ